MAVRGVVSITFTECVVGGVEVEYRVIEKAKISDISIVAASGLLKSLIARAWIIIDVVVEK